MTPFWFEFARVVGFVALVALVVLAWSGVLLALDHLIHWILERRSDRPE